MPFGNTLTHRVVTARIIELLAFAPITALSNYFQDILALRTLLLRSFAYRLVINLNTAFCMRPSASRDNTLLNFCPR